MARQRKAKVDVYGTFPKRWAKIIEEMPEFKSEAQQMDAVELKKVIVDCSKKVSEIEKAKDEDLDLKSLQEQLKEASSGYKQITKENEAKKRFAVYLLESRGDSASDITNN
jgi:hypothetical protein